MKHIFSLVLLTLFYIVGILIFTSGFLLRRVVINERNTCSIDKNSCLRQDSFNKVIIILIDALRYDFLLYNKSLETSLSFQNNFKHLNNLLETKPNHGGLYCFRADPPTTTLQRLKALTTGSLPTFIDAGSNFGKVEIDEDNLISQVLNLNSSITFMGDDTWTGLYPNHFNVSYPYSSFNVKDLDTVDNGVIEHTISEMQKGNYSLMISHLLGVDHCGHTFGPYHERMKQKLIQMDDFIKQVVAEMDEKSILFVIGDHGMTRTGDHGGDSPDEVDAGLFIYSKKKLFNDISSQTPRQIDQIDLVPTLSLLLNVPIPYQNLGMVIKELFKNCLDCDITQNEIFKKKEAFMNYLKVLNVNALQVRNYVESYLRKTTIDENLLTLNNKFLNSKSKYDTILRKFKENSDSIKLEDLENMEKLHLDYLNSVRNRFKNSWAQFDLVRMTVGLVITIGAFITNICFIAGENQIFSLKILSTISFFLLLVSYFYFNSDEHSVFLILFIFSLVFLFYLTSIRNQFKFLIDFQSLLSFFFWVTYSFSLLSNSYLVYESLVIQFFIKSSLLLQTFLVIHKVLKAQFQNFSNSLKTFKTISSQISQDILIFIGHVIIKLSMLFILLNVSKCYYTCREEQMGCEDGWFVNDLLNSSSSNTRNKLLISSFSLLFLTFCVFKWLRRSGSLEGWKITSFFGSYFLFVNVAFIIVYWCFISVLPANYSSSHLNTFVQIVYILSFLSIILITIFPSTLHFFVQPSTELSFNSLDLTYLNPCQVIPSIFNHIKSSWQPSSNVSKPTVYVYGLSNLYSSPLIIVTLNIIFVLSLLLGLNVSSSFVLYMGIHLLFLEMHPLLQQSCNKDNDKPEIGFVSISSTTVFLLITSHHFYAFSHHPTITSIKWNAAFVGMNGENINHVFAAIMIFMNTFSSQVVGMLISPMLLYWPLVRTNWWKFYGKMLKLKDCNKSNISQYNNKFQKSLQTNGTKYIPGKVSESDNEPSEGEYHLNDDFETHSIRLTFKILFFLAIKVLATIVCVSLHRRHLMVWKVFAPRFIYEISSFSVSSLILIFTYIFSISTNRTVKRFIKSLTDFAK